MVGGLLNRGETVAKAHAGARDSRAEDVSARRREDNGRRTSDGGQRIMDADRWTTYRWTTEGGG